MLRDLIKHILQDQDVRPAHARRRLGPEGGGGLSVKTDEGLRSQPRTRIRNDAVGKISTLIQHGEARLDRGAVSCDIFSYVAMSTVIFGAAPEFDAVIENVAARQSKLNEASSQD